MVAVTELSALEAKYSILHIIAGVAYSLMKPADSRTCIQYRTSFGMIRPLTRVLQCTCHCAIVPL